MKDPEHTPTAIGGGSVRPSGRARRTPCVGVCSTTYGDLVCRGCKRFAHEIVDWNRYSDSQRAEIMERLETLRSGAVLRFLSIPEGRSPLAAVALLLKEDEQEADQARGVEWRRRWAARDIGIDPAIDSLEQLLEAIDGELLIRSRGVYERSFRISIQ
ncbi:MAG: DUF1289 domain-containing protein [Pseudomonadota bacterium]